MARGGLAGAILRTTIVAMSRAPRQHPAPIIRPPRVAEADDVAALHVRTWQETYADVLPVGYIDDGHREMRRRMWRHVLSLADDERRVRVADVDGEMVGIGMAGPSDPGAPRDRQLYLIYVLAAHHGTGVGQALFDAVLGDAPAMLTVAKGNARAIAFYTRQGFAFDGEEHVDPATPRLIEARMVR